MIKTTSLTLLNLGFIPKVSDECLYIITYNNHCLYVGQCVGRGGYSIVCRLGRHFGADIDKCLHQQDRSGASRQFNTMLSRLPKEVQEQFTLTLLQPHEVSHFVNLDTAEIRLKIISAGLSVETILSGSKHKKVIGLCEKMLSWSLCPTYCKSGYCDCTSGLPDELIKYLRS